MAKDKSDRVLNLMKDFCKQMVCEERCVAVVMTTLDEDGKMRLQTEGFSAIRGKERICPDCQTRQTETLTLICENCGRALQ